MFALVKKILKLSDEKKILTDTEGAEDSKNRQLKDYCLKNVNEIRHIFRENKSLREVLDDEQNTKKSIRKNITYVSLAE